MPYIKKYKKVAKTKPVGIFFVLIIPEIIIALSLVLIVGQGFWPELLMASPVVFYAAPDIKPLHNNNPLEVVAVSVVHVDSSIKYNTEKVIVVAERAVQKISEARLKIPRIGVDAVIKDMGMTLDGAMAVPGNRVDVGWFSLGTRPGEMGSAVIGGHNSWATKAGIFANLDQLQKGDVLSVVDANGASFSFIVRDIRTYDATDTDTGIFDSKSGIHLNLITCSGEWDPSTKSSAKRLVVFTDVIENANKIAMVPVPPF